MKKQFKILKAHFYVRGMFILLISLFISTNLSSQEIQNFDIVKAQSETSSNSKNSNLHSLYYENQPSLIIKSNKTITTSERQAKVLEINVSDLSLLNKSKLNLQSIELIRVIYNKSDKVSKLDLSIVENLPMLKAIVFQCDFDCMPNEIKSLIKSKAKNSPSIYYLVSIPE